MQLRHPIIKGTFILTATGLLTRFMGFFYRIFLSHTFGEENVGLYQLIFPIYALGYSATCSGIQTVLSRCVSERLTYGKKREARLLLYTGLLITFTLSCCFSVLLQSSAAFLAGSLLGDSRCEPLLVLLSYAFPFSAIHSCITGYCLGMKDAKIPASSQLLEQIIRISTVLLLCQMLAFAEIKAGIWIAVLGLIAGETASSFYSLRQIRKCSGIRVLIPPALPLSSVLHDSIHLIKLSIPLTANRVLLNILQSIEAVSIPTALQIYGLSQSSALRTYGVLTGMALPCILFPCALTNSVCAMLLPSIAEAQAKKEIDRLRKMIRLAVFGCIFLGIGCMCVFFLFHGLIGNLLFCSALAGSFIQILSWICPFLYANNALISIIHGLGKTGISFLMNSASLMVRIVSVLYITTHAGIRGYLYGLLASQILLFLAGILYIFYYQRHFQAPEISL